MISFIQNLVPNAKHIVNYRKNTTAQLQSQFQRSSSDVILRNKLSTMRSSLHDADTFDLLLEEFNVWKFNRLLLTCEQRWIQRRQAKLKVLVFRTISTTAARTTTTGVLTPVRAVAAAAETARARAVANEDMLIRHV